MARLILSGLGERAVGNLELFERVKAHKKVFFRSSWAHYDRAKRGSLRLVPSAERVEALAEDYDRMQEMFFTEPPAFTEVLRILAKWENNFNK
jgi:hypothetical protein